MPNQTSFSALQLGGATLAVIAATTVGYFMGNIQTTGTITSQNITATGAIAGQSLSGNTLYLGGGQLTVTANSFGGFSIKLTNITGATLSGATVTAGGGLQVMNGNGGRFTTLEGDTVSGTTLRNTNGSFVVNLTSYPELYIQRTLTGNVLHAEKTLTSSGTLVVNGNIFGRATMSGNVLHIEKGITGSGTLIIEGATNFVGGMSGASIVNSALGGHVNTLRCTKAGGVEGYIAVTASGTIAKSGGAISCQ